jgi:hypothetical protein
MAFERSSIKSGDFSDYYIIVEAMTATNELIIQMVFDEMLKYKPSLQKMLVTEEEEAFDPRMQGDIIIRNFPWPIGIELRRLFSATMRQPDRLRLDQIFKTIERTLQFICFVLTCQIWKDKKDGKLEISGKLPKEIYLEWKNEHWPGIAEFPMYKDKFLSDISFESIGIKHPDFDKARDLLKK